MKGFIEVTRKLDGVKSLVNINKIRVVYPVDFGCVITLDNPIHISGAKVVASTVDDSTIYKVDVNSEPALLEVTNTYRDVLALIDACSH